MHPVKMYCAEFFTCLIIFASYCLGAHYTPFYPIDYVSTNPAVIPVRILAEKEIYDQFPFEFWSAQVQELNLLMQTLPAKFDIVLVTISVEIAIVEKLDDGYTNVHIPPSNVSGNGIVVLVSGKPIDPQPIEAGFCAAGRRGTQHNFLNIPLSLFFSERNKWRLAVKLLDRLKICESPLIKHTQGSESMECDGCAQGIYNLHEDSHENQFNPFMLDHCNNASAVLNRGKDQSCFRSVYSTQGIQREKLSYISANNYCRWTFKDPFAWTANVDCKKTACFNSDGESIGFIVPVYNTPCNVGRVCRKGHCVYRAVQISNWGSSHCLHAEPFSLVRLSKCREGTYRNQRFVLSQQRGTSQYYVVRKGNLESNNVDSCLAIYIRPEPEIDDINPDGGRFRYLQLDPCTWGNDSLLWTLIKTKNNGSLEYSIYNAKTHLYLTADHYRILLRDTYDPFDYNFLWDFFKLEAQELLPDQVALRTINDLKIRTSTIFYTPAQTESTTIRVQTETTTYSQVDTSIKTLIANSKDIDNTTESTRTLVDSFFLNDLNISTSITLFIVLGVTAASTICIGAICCCRRRRRTQTTPKGPTKKAGNSLPTSFFNGATQCLNPEMEPLQQLELLPFNIAWEFPEEHLQMGPKLGEGAFGSVFKGFAKNILGDGVTREVAIKMLKHENDKEKIETLTAEMKILGNLKFHCNIVNLLGVCTRGSNIKVILEICSLGDLRNYIVRHRSKFVVEILFIADNATGYQNLNTAEYNTHPPHANDTAISTSQLTSWAYQVAMGMSFLSSKRIVHGDLAARNVLLTSEKIVKICDFGLSRKLYSNYGYIYKKDIEGALLPFKWMAIESIQYGLFSAQTDCWSFGILMWELYSLGQNPYPGMDMNKSTIDKIEKGYRMDKPNYAPSRIYNIMLQCWSTNPDDRPTFKNLSEKIEEIMDTRKLIRYKEVTEDYDRLNRLRRVPDVDYFVRNPNHQSGAVKEDEEGYLRAF